MVSCFSFWSCTPLHSIQHPAFLWVRVCWRNVLLATGCKLFSIYAMVLTYRIFRLQKLYHFGWLWVLLNFDCRLANDIWRMNSPVLHNLHNLYRLYVGLYRFRSCDTWLNCQVTWYVLHSVVAQSLHRLFESATALWFVKHMLGLIYPRFPCNYCTGGMSLYHVRIWTFWPLVRDWRIPSSLTDTLYFAVLSLLLTGNLLQFPAV